MATLDKRHLNCYINPIAILSGPQMITAKILTILHEHCRAMDPFLSGMGRPMVSLPDPDNPGLLQHIDVKSGVFRNWFRERLLLTTGLVLSDEALKTGMNMLADRSSRGGIRETGVRVIRRPTTAYLDLRRGDGKVVEIDAEGWREIFCPKDVRFIPSPAGAALPSPQGGNCSIAQLGEYVNLSDQEDFALVVSWLMGAFMGYEMPILVMNGQQNSGKSTNSHILHQVLDPTVAIDLLTKPKSDRDLVSDIANRFVMVYDNISKIDEWFSNMLCCLSTGGTFGGRALWSDMDTTRFQAVRPMILNGIPEFVGFDDLKRRMFHINVPTVNKNQKSKEIIYEGFKTAHPAILGSILDAVVVAFQNRMMANTPTPKALPLRDPILWANSASEAFGFKKDFILDVAAKGAELDLEESFNNNYLAQAIFSFMEKLPEWKGQSGQLLKDLWLHKPVGTREGFWPDSPKGLTTMLQKAGPSLQQRGLVVTRRKTNRGWLTKLEWAEDTVRDLPASDSGIPVEILRDSKRRVA